MIMNLTCDFVWPKQLFLWLFVILIVSCQNIEFGNMDIGIAYLSALLVFIS